MEIRIDFPGGACVEAVFSAFTLKTAQPPPTGVASTPTPFELFLAAIGACAGSMVLAFCRQLELPIEGMQLFERAEVDPETGLVNQVFIDIQLPPNFPIKYRRALVRVAEQCLVKQQLEQPPRVMISASEQGFYSPTSVAAPTA